MEIRDSKGDFTFPFEDLLLTAKPERIARNPIPGARIRKKYAAIRQHLVFAVTSVLCFLWSLLMIRADGDFLGI
jgi:hypothetical protein